MKTRRVSKRNMLLWCEIAAATLSLLLGPLLPSATWAQDRLVQPKVAERNVSLGGSRSVQRFTYVGPEGNQIGQHVYEFARRFENGLGIARRDGLWGAIDVRGAATIPFEYQELYCAAIRVTDQTCFARKDRYWSVITTSGRVVHKNAFDKIRFDSAYSWSRVRKDGKWGFIAKRDGRLLSPRFEAAGPAGFAPDRLLSAIVRENGAWKVVDEEGRILQELDVDHFVPEVGAGVGRQRGETVILTPIWQGHGGNLPVLYQAVKSPEASEYVVEDVVSTDHQAVLVLGESRVAVQRNEQWMLFDTNGDFVTASVFDKIEPFSEGLAAATFLDRCGYIDSRGRWRIPPKFYICRPFSVGVAAVYEDKDNPLFIDQQGTAIRQLAGFSAEMFDKQAKKTIASRVGENGKVQKGVLQRNGEFTPLPSGSGSFGRFVAPELVTVRGDERRYWGLATLDGNVVVEPFTPFPCPHLVSIPKNLLPPDIQLLQITMRTYGERLFFLNEEWRRDCRPVRSDKTVLLLSSGFAILDLAKEKLYPPIRARSVAITNDGNILLGFEKGRYEVRQADGRPLFALSVGSVPENSVDYASDGLFTLHKSGWAFLIRGVKQ